LHIGSDFALSRLDLTEELKGDFEQYILHPCIIDGALQTVIGIATGREPNTPHLPFAVDEVEILQPLTETCYVYVEHAIAENSVNSEIKQFNIRLLGENGDVRVKRQNPAEVHQAPQRFICSGFKCGRPVLPRVLPRLQRTDAYLLLGAAPDADALRAHLQNEQEQDCVDDPGILAHRGH